MVKRCTEGFTLLESLVVMVMIVLMGFVFHLPKTMVKSRPLLGIVDAQLLAMATSERSYVNDDLWFNGRGNINHAQTIWYQNLRCVFQLGMGRYRCAS